MCDFSREPLHVKPFGRWTLRVWPPVDNRQQVMLSCSGHGVCWSVASADVAPVLVNPFLNAPQSAVEMLLSM